MKSISESESKITVKLDNGKTVTVRPKVFELENLKTVRRKDVAEKIKEAIDDLMKEMEQSASTCPSKKEKIKLSNIDFEDLDLNTLIQIQARISRLILEKSK